MNSPKDFTHKGWLAATALILVLVVVSVIPPQTIGGVKLRRANIFSDLLSFDDAQDSQIESGLFNEEDFRINMAEVSEMIESDSARKQVQTTFEWVLSGPKSGKRPLTAPDSVLLSPQLIPIENYDPSGKGIESFYDTLLLASRPVRIAFLGDSFIEGDILTADLREQLQRAYGGGGAGFAPMASPLTAFRRTIKTQSRGWTTYNIMQHRTVPQSLRENFFISGWVCQAGSGASTRWENTSARPRLDSCTSARVLFISPADSRIEMTLNDTLRREFPIQGDASVRQITVSAPHIHSLTFRVLSGAEGMIGYGAQFESHGVVVDNYSIRSNNGQAMFWTNPSVNAQINSMLRYDLVIMQYGLNVMQDGVHNYSNYGRQIEKMAAYVRECFPGATILILGVSDRAVRGEGGITPMDAVPHMLSHQRSAAQRSGTAFWPTCEAMRSQGGMSKFVANGWAGKDFTHINYAGGRRIAWSLFDAFNAKVRESHTEIIQIEERKKDFKSILDPTNLKQI